jgi:DNA (cytosine-5)-methyltransferase 1
MGLWEACRNYEMKLEVVMGCDLFDAAESSFVANFSPEFFLNQPIEQYVNGELGAELTPEEKLLKERLGRIHVVVGGPPCQGNSNLNNHTRRTDSRNELYMRMIRFIEIIQPDIALIENVSGVMRAKQNVVQRSNEYLNNLGYVSRHGVVKGVNIGIPQTRVRHFTVAVKDGNDFSFDEIGDPTFESPRPVSWAIADLLGIEKGDDIFNNPPSATPVNQKRMDYLFEHEIYNLPNKERPPCQQKAHTYPAIYSRMWWDKPAPTLTTGFGCNGRGRFTHPKEARVLTPHEAARVQTFPDFFDFTIIKKRTDLHRLIGNAVPPLMATHVLVPLLDNFLRLQGVNN